MLPIPAFSVRPPEIAQTDDFAAAADRVRADASASAAQLFIARSDGDAEEAEVAETTRGVREAIDDALPLRAPAPVLSTAMLPIPAFSVRPPEIAQTDDFAAAADRVRADASAAGSNQPAALQTFKRQLRDASISFDESTLERLALLGAKNGVCDLDDLRDLSEADVRASVEEMSLNPVQMKKLLKSLGLLDVGPPSKVARYT
jgi:hypothetical protein